MSGWKDGKDGWMSPWEGGDQNVGGGGKRT